MLQSFLIIKEPGKRAPTSLVPMPPETREMSNLRSMPESFLSECGFRTAVARKEQDAKHFLLTVDAVILQVEAERLSIWSARILAWRDAPIFWWCDESLGGPLCSFDFELDGLLYSHMTKPQLYWGLEHGTAKYLQRTQWKKEREQLAARLEERKTIDRAKAILCEIKRINETEAYEFLRKQAMNDRKRMIDVAQSIVRVYELLHNEEDKGG